MKNIILIGLGPHAKRIYYPFLLKHKIHFDIRLKLLIELEGQANNISKFLINKNLQPEKIVYIADNDQNRSGRILDAIAKHELDSLIKHENIHGIIISTEPKAHKIYA